MNELDKLAQHRNAILLAEVAAWLHMLGKYHEDFLQGNHDLDIQIPPDLTTDYPTLHQLLTNPWPGQVWVSLSMDELGAEALSIFDLIRNHRNRNAPSGLERLMWDAHGRGSGIEKGALNRFAPGQRTTVYPATAIGSEFSEIDLDKLQERRKALYADLQQALEQLRTSDATLDWATLRSTLIRRLETDFRCSVAETRRPLNDVTIFDQTAASVALFKTALAQNLLVGWKEPNQQSIPNKYRWRVLRVGFDGLTFWGQSARLTDVIAQRATCACTGPGENSLGRSVSTGQRSLSG